MTLVESQRQKKSLVAMGRDTLYPEDGGSTFIREFLFYVRNSTAMSPTIVNFIYTLYSMFQ
jgi:hypothetical protein